MKKLIRYRFLRLLTELIFCLILKEEKFDIIIFELRHFLDKDII